MQQGIPTRHRVLTDDQIASFIANGYLMVPQVFSPTLAEQIVPMVWTELGLDPHNQSDWHQPMVILEKVIESSPVPQMYTDRYLGTIDDLCGPGRWRSTQGAGWWPILFPGFAGSPWQPPKSGWHMDGTLAHNHLGAPGRGLIGLELFTLIEPADGGTMIRVGSHRDTVRILWASEPEGLNGIDLENKVTAASDHRPVHEMTGRPGDVLLMHPYTVHAASANTGSRVRILSNKPIWLHAPMDLSRTDINSYSPVERAVVEALPV